MATKLEETPLNAKIGGKAHSDGTPGTLGEKTSTPQSEALGGPASQQTSEGDAGIDGKESSENLNSDTDGTAGLTAEERAREERVRRNKERMAALGLLDTSRELASTAAAQKRAASGDRGSGRTAKRQRGTVAPKRHSRRVAQEAPELAGLADTRAPSGAASAAVPDLPLDEPIVLRGGLGDLGDAAFLAALRRRGASSEMERLRERAGASLDEYALSPRYVRKIAGTGTPNLSMLPRSDMLAVAAGDMSGRLCLWIADWPSLTHGSSDEGEAEGRRIVEEDGAVAVFTAHRGRVTGLRTWGGGTGAEVLTAGEDGGVRRMELHRGEMEPVWAEEGRELSAMEVGDKGVVFLADKEGNVGAVDWRTKKGLVTDFFKAQSRKINTLSLDADMHTLASASTDSTIRLWDIRRWGREAKHTCQIDLPVAKDGVCQAAAFCPDGSGRLLVTSEDYTIRFYGKPDGGEASLEREIPHDNNKGCFHMPFRAVWTADGQSALCGSRSRGIDVIRASDGALSRLESPIQKTNCHRICCHPDRNVPVIAAAGSGGGMHLYCPL